MEQGKTAYVFPGANTAAGYHSFFRSGLNGLENIFILKGGPGCGKSTLIRRIADRLRERGLDVELWQCSADLDSLDGVLIPALSAAVVDGTPPHVVEPRYPGAVEELIDLGQCWRGAELKQQRSRIIALNGQIGGYHRQAQAYLAEAGRLLRGGEGSGGEGKAVDGSQMGQSCNMAAKSPAYAGVNQAVNVDIGSAGGLAPAADPLGQTPDFASLSARVFGSKGQGCRHLFAASVAPSGWVSFLEPLSRRAGRRLILTGPFGQGKEELLGRLAAEARRRRVYAELYHHPLAPAALQMLWLPGLDIAVLAVEQAPPHRQGDEIFPCGPEAEGEQRLEIRRLIVAAGEQIARAKQVHDELEACYTPAMDFGLVEEYGARLLARLLALPLVEDK